MARQVCSWCERPIQSSDECHYKPARAFRAKGSSPPSAPSEAQSHTSAAALQRKAGTGSSASQVTSAALAPGSLRRTPFPRTN